MIKEGTIISLLDFVHHLGYSFEEIRHQTVVRNLGKAQLHERTTKLKNNTWKIGASASLLMETITLLSFMPARCWMAPEIPTAI